MGQAQSTTISLFRTTVARKMVMAISGIVLFGFILIHMIGNLQLYAGDGGLALNQYAAFLKATPPLLWGTRIILLLAVVLHIWSAIELTLEARAARPQRYAVYKPRKTTYASRTMIWGGLIVALFIIYHLAQFTVAGVGIDNFSHTNVYRNVVKGFSSVPVSGFYIVAMVALGFHLFHGAVALFQSLGLSHPRYDTKVRGAAVAIAGVIVVGNISFPISVMAGLVQ